jgi:hypothetical protein
MRWLFRIALIFCILGLTTLVVIPYLPTLREYAELAFGAWSGEAEAAPLIAKPTSTEETNTPPPPRRAVIVPPTALDGPSTATDPLLQEARRLAETDPAAAMAWLQTQANGPERLRGMLEVVALWAAEDSENAMLWLESNAQGIARLETLNSGVALWAEQDPTAASEWIDGMAYDSSKIEAAKALAGQWVTSSPDDAAAWVGTLPIGALRTEASSALVKSWAQVDPEQATVWALSEAEFNGRTELLNLSIQQYARNQPTEAEQFVRELTEAYEAPDAVETYIKTRAENDPADAMNWQSQLPDQDPLNQPENARIIMQEWSRTDSVAASGWLSGQPAGPERDAAIIGFNSTMLDFEPEAAVAWANFISEPQSRSDQLTESIRTWAKTQPRDALDWVKSAELDPDLRARLASEIGAD